MSDAEGPVLLFDGHCNLCNGAVQFVIRHDPEAVFSFAPLQSETGERLRKRADVPTDATESVVLVEGDDAHVKSDAVLRVARRLGLPWSLLWGFRFVPGSIRDAVYDVVAEHRYQVFGRREECMLPSPEVQDRFLDTA
ncbi:MAG: thiol-disulfide oxidoreductase DCC family protein [Halobacteriaceae archaeon]